MTKPAAPDGGTPTASTDMISESGGAPRVSSRMNAAQSSSAPSARTITPSVSLSTLPLIRCLAAAWNTKGRKPTPCTIPLILIS